MKYLLLMYADEAKAPQTPEELQTVAQAWFDFNKELLAAGVLVSNNGLAPSTDATTLRVRDGKSVISEGPFAETPEHLSGYYLLNCQDLNEALGWAAKIPVAQYGSIEIRPLNTYSQRQ